MTYETACDIVISESKRHGLYDYESLFNAENLVSVACYKADKYCWHNIEKDENDLPHKDGLYAIALKYDEETIDIGFGQFENMYGYSSGWSATMPSYGKIIAWKEIEPFDDGD